MVERNRIRLLTGVIAAAFLPGITGCAGPYWEAPPPYGHPPHYYDYYYYPNVFVYFHIYTGWYYYWDDGIWWRVRKLPPHIRLHPEYRVLLHIRDEYPYLRHDEHRRQFPPPSPEGPRAIEPPATERPQPPRIVPDPRSDREEREHNLQRYEEYKKKPWLRPRP